MIPTLHPFQFAATENVVAEARSGKRVIILQSPTGCHGIGQGILMHNGTIKPVEKVAVGDNLMGPDSKLRTVVSLVRGHGPMFRICPVKGQDFVVNGDHILTLCRTNARKAIVGKKRRSDAKENGELLDVSVSEWLAWSKTRKHLYKLVRTGVEFPYHAELPIHPYFLGLLLGDGCFCGTPDVTTADAEIVAELSYHAATFGLQVKEYRKTDNNAATYRFTSGIRPTSSTGCFARGGNALVEALRACNLMQRRSHDKLVPRDYLTASLSDRLQLLAGLIDTDGSLSSGCYDCISKSPKLADGLAFLARSCGLAAYTSPCEKCDQHGTWGVYYRVSISGDTDKIPCRIPSKQASSRRQKKNVLRTGFHVEPLCDDDFFGFSLTGDGRYLLDDFTITHNSGKSTMGCDLVRRARHKDSNVLFIVHRRRLVDQFSQRLTEFEIDHGVMMRGHSMERLARVQVASRDTLISRCIKREFFGLPPAQLVIVDEGRHAAAPEFMGVMRHYQQQRAVIVLLDATPVTADGAGLGPWAQSLVVAAKVTDLVRDGYLVPIQCYAPDRKHHRNGKTRRGIAGDLVESWQQYAEGMPTVLFCSRVQHSLDAVEAFKVAGIPAAHVDADTDDDDRDRIYDGLETGAVKVVSNVGIIKEGVDIPCLGCCQFYMDPAGRVGFLQGCGRIMRPYPGKTHGVLIDHAGAVYRHGFPDEDTEWTLEGNVDADFDQKHKDGLTEQVHYCKRCELLYRELACPQCGRQPSKPPRSIFAPPPVDSTNEILTEAERNQAAQAWTREERIKFWFICLRIAIKNGTSFAQASMIYKKKYGEWPDNDFPCICQPWQRKMRVADLFPNFGKKKVAQ